MASAGIKTVWNWVARGGGPRFAHCFASCESQKCGGPTVAATLGLAKEAFDLEVCERLTGIGLLSTIRQKHCDSAYQPSDLGDNQQGLDCPPGEPCEDQCGDLFGAPDTLPGPFGGQP